ncbi:MAG: hypothetical protein LBT29_02160 [Flavobacteriaceae bacterium]|jgi:hypothetical protein|nr:hypothetical protein [Flavobacteriaceae bacterium]
MVIFFPFIFSGNFQGMAIFPFIFVRYKEMKENQTLINHERIHLRQQIELLWIFFFLLYFGEYLVNFIKFRNSDRAYRSISFEQEAYFNEKNLSYLQHRKFWNFLRYYYKRKS